MSRTLVSLFVSHPVALRQYTRLIHSQPDLAVAGAEDTPQVGVLDGELPYLDTVLSLARMKYPQMRLLLLSPPCDESESLRWLLRGIWGLVLFDRLEQELCPAIRSLAKGQLWFHGAMTAEKLPLDSLVETPQGGVALTDREREILGLLLRRLSNKEISSCLNISIRTVKFHVGNVLNKLRVTSRQELWKNSLETASADPTTPLLKTLYHGPAETN